MLSADGVLPDSFVTMSEMTVESSSSPSKAVSISTAVGADTASSLGVGGAGFGGFEDIFSSFFGGGARQANPNAPRQGDDLRMDVTISFEEAAKGCEKEVNVVRDETCENCGGTGAKPGTKPTTCP